MLFADSEDENTGAWQPMFRGKNTRTDQDFLNLGIMVICITAALFFVYFSTWAPSSSPPAASAATTHSSSSHCRLPRRRLDGLQQNVSTTESATKDTKKSPVEATPVTLQSA